MLKMEAFNFTGFSAVPARSLLDFTPLSAPQKRHVSKIYAALTVNVLLTAVGVYAQLRWVSLPTFLSLLLSIGCVFGLTSSSQKAHAESQVRTYKAAAAVAAAVAAAAAAVPLPDALMPLQLQLCMQFCAELLFLSFPV